MDWFGLGLGGGVENGVVVGRVFSLRRGSAAVRQLWLLCEKWKVAKHQTCNYLTHTHRLRLRLRLAVCIQTHTHRLLQVAPLGSVFVCLSSSTTIELGELLAHERQTDTRAGGNCKRGKRGALSPTWPLGHLLAQLCNHFEWQMRHAHTRAQRPLISGPVRGCVCGRETVCSCSVSLLHFFVHFSCFFPSTFHALLAQCCNWAPFCCHRARSCQSAALAAPKPVSSARAAGASL